MSTALKASVILVVLVGLLSVATIGTGLHKMFPLGALLFIAGAIIINVAVVYWALSRTATECTYGGQMLNALLIGAVGGALIFGFSMLNVTTIFPDSLEETRQAQLEAIEASKDSDELKQARIRAVNDITPVSQAVPGAMGTLFTSLIGGAIVAVFQRKR